MFSGVKFGTIRDIITSMRDQDQIEDHRDPTIKPVGHVNYSCGDGVTHKVILYNGVEFNEWAAGNNTFGEPILLFPTTVDLTNLDDEFWGTLAHELGHLICNHAERTNTQRDVSPEFHELALDGDIASNRYLNRVQTSILKGSLLPLEIEADLIATRFVGLPTIVYIQAMELSKLNTPSVYIEKINRIRYLANLCAKEYGPKEGYTMEVIRYVQDTTESP